MLIHKAGFAEVPEHILWEHSDSVKNILFDIQKLKKLNSVA
jgi:hypothetical protein